MKALLAAVLATLVASTALAQVPAQRNQVYVAIGDPGLIFIVNDIADDIVGEMFSLGHVSYGAQRGGLQVSFGYERRLGTWNGVGVTGSWAGSSKRVYFDGRDIGSVERQLLSLTFDWRAHWLRLPSADLYSGLSSGVLNLGDRLGAPGGRDDSMTGAAFQIVPIGARLGRTWGGYVETGIGTHGFFKAGLSRRF